MNLDVSFFVLFANLYSSKWEHNIHFHLWIALLRRETKDTLCCRQNLLENVRFYRDYFWY